METADRLEYLKLLHMLPNDSENEKVKMDEYMNGIWIAVIKGSSQRQRREIVMNLMDLNELMTIKIFYDVDENGIVLHSKSNSNRGYISFPCLHQITKSKK